MTNNKIGNMQILIISFFLSGALFVGYGSNIILTSSNQDSWIIVLFSSFIGLIMIHMLSKIMSYKPETNILEKNKILFGNLIGNLVNIILVFIVVMLFMIMIIDVGSFINLKYLYDTPIIYICAFFMLPIIYASIKGLETIARTTQILFYINLVFVIVISIVLFLQFDIDNIKPVLVDSPLSYLDAAVKFLIYSCIPFIMLLIIPKNSIRNNKNLTKYLISGYMFGTIFISIVLFVIIGVAGVDILRIYNYPEYYVLKKVSLGFIGFDNIENILAIHWSINLFVLLTLALYYMKKYFSSILKIIDTKKVNVMTILLGILLTILSFIIFPTFTTAFTFVKTNFIYFCGLPLLVLVFTSYIIILLKKI